MPQPGFICAFEHKQHVRVMKHTDDKLSRQARLMKTLQRILNFHWLTPHIKIGILTDLHYSVWLHNTAVSALCYQKQKKNNNNKKIYHSLLMTSIQSLLIRQIYKLHSWDLFPFLMQTLNFQPSLKTDKTGVWHWNSSQRIKGSILPASQSVTLHFRCGATTRWLMLSAFQTLGLD